MADMENIEAPESANFLHLTARFTRAIDYARQVHVNYRKATKVPYVAHLIGVASLVMGESGYVHFPVTEDMVIGALLHDAVEDEGGWPRLRDIEANFGPEVAKIVEGCTDTERPLCQAASLCVEPCLLTAGFNTAGLAP